MSTLTVALDLPRDLLGALDAPQARLEAPLRELIALHEARGSPGGAKPHFLPSTPRLGQAWDRKRLMEC